MGLGSGSFGMFSVIYREPFYGFDPLLPQVLARW